MQALKTCSLVLLYLYYATCSNIKRVNDAEPRLLGNRYTKTVLKPHIITSFVPSSCIQVASTLPPCRTLRSFTRFIEGRSISNNSLVDVNTNSVKEPEVQTTPLSWGEYLGIYAPTVTVTSTQVITTTVVDSGVQVTYAIKGCRPKILPEGMERCAFSENDQYDNLNILPTSTSIEVTPTQSPLTEIIHQNGTENDSNVNVDETHNTATPILIESSSIDENDLSTFTAVPTTVLTDITTPEV